MAVSPDKSLQRSGTHDVLGRGRPVKSVVTRMRNIGAPILLTTTSAVFCAEEWSVRVDGIGPVKIGATARELSVVLGQEVTMPTEEDEKGCFYVEDKRHSGVSYMLTSGRVARIDVDTRGTATLSGAMVGDSAERLINLYGADFLEKKPHFYSGLPNLYMTYWARNRQYGVRFETSDGKIARFYAGKIPELEYVEGCL